MKNKQSKWQTEQLAATFLKGVRGAIPEAGLQLDLIGYIIESWYPRPRQILDLGCGDGIIGRFLFDQFPEAHVIFADFSDPMLDALRGQLREKAQTTIVRVDFSSPSWVDAICTLEPIDVVVSGFAIHHQSDPRKKALYAEIFNLLTDGGLFLNLEHVASSTRDVTSLFDSYFVDHLYEFHRKKDPTVSMENVAKVYYDRSDKEENILAPAEVQCEWLRQIGFTDVDCFFRVFELALFGGRKAPTTIGHTT